MSGVKFIIFRTFSVDAENVLLQFSVRHFFILRRFGAAALHPALQVSVNEYAERLKISQNIVAAPSHDNAVRLLRHLRDDAGLFLINRKALLQSR